MFYGMIFFDNVYFSLYLMGYCYNRYIDRYGFYMFYRSIDRYGGYMLYMFIDRYDCYMIFNDFVIVDKFYI